MSFHRHRFDLEDLERRDMQLRGELRGLPLERHGVALELRQVEESGAFEGYASVWGVKDAHGDIVSPGAFAASLSAHAAAGTLPAMLWQHDAAEPIGVWLEMREDARGLFVRGQLVLETERGRAAYALLKAGALRGLSIGFRTVRAAEDHLANARRVEEVELWEVSLVTFASNGQAQITGIKAAVDAWTRPQDAERALRDAGFSRSDATALVSRVMRFGAERREAALELTQASEAVNRLLANLSA